MSETRWVGGINGSRVGNVYWSEMPNGTGNIAIGQSDGNTLRFDTRKSADAENIYILGAIHNESGEQQELGQIALETQNASMRAGTWSLADGSAGMIEVVVKQVGKLVTAENPLENSQLQIANKTVRLGAVTLYRPDLERVIAELETYFNDPVVPIIQAKEGDQFTTRNAAEYLSRGDLPDMVKEITIGVEASSGNGLKKIANVTLSDDLDSKIYVSSPDELWTEAVAQRLEQYFKGFTSTFTGFLRRHGLNINSVLLLFLIIALPEFELFERIVISALALGLMIVVFYSHKLVPYARIYLDPDQVKRPFSKEMPSVILGGVATTLFAGLTALPKITEWVTNGLEKIGQLFGF